MQVQKSDLSVVFSTENNPGLYIFSSCDMNPISYFCFPTLSNYTGCSNDGVKTFILSPWCLPPANGILFKSLSSVLVIHVSGSLPIRLQASQAKFRCPAFTQPGQCTRKDEVDNNETMVIPGVVGKQPSLETCLLLGNPKCLLWTCAQIQAVIFKRTLLRGKRSGLTLLICVLFILYFF